MKILQNKKLLYVCYFLLSLFLLNLIDRVIFLSILYFYYDLFGGAYQVIFNLQSVVAFIYIMNYHFGVRIKLFFLGNRYENLRHNTDDLFENMETPEKLKNAVEEFRKEINSTESSNDICYTTDFNSSQLKRVFLEYSKSFLMLLFTVAIGVLNVIGGVLILFSRDRDLIEGYTIFSICISVIVFFVSVYALYKLYIISDKASK